MSVETPVLSSRPRNASRSRRGPDLEGPATAAITALAFVVPALAAAPITTEGRSAAAAVGWTVLALALIFGLLPRGVPTRRSRHAAVALSVLAVWTLLSLLWTDTAEGTVVEVARIAFLGLYPVAVWLGVRPSNWQPAVWGLVVACLALPALAVIARIWPEPFSSLSPDLGDGLRRLSFPLGYWNALGVWSAAAVAAGLAIAAGVRGPARRSAAGAALPFAALAVYLSYSRAALALALAGAFVAVILSRDRRRALTIAATAGAGSFAAALVARSNEEIATGVGAADGWTVAVTLAAAAVASAVAARTPVRRAQPEAARGRRLGVAALAGAVALALIAAVLVEGPSERAATPPQSAGEASLPGDPAVRLATLDSTRYRLWGSTVDAYLSEPLTGIGAGSFSIWWGNERDADDERVADAHSLLLESLAELGPVGLGALIAFVGLLFAAALAARSSLRGATEEALWMALMLSASVVVLAAAVDWLWESGLVFAWALAALALAAVPALREEGTGRRSRPGPRVLALVVAFACFAVQVPVLVSTSSQEDAAAAILRGDLLAAEAEADRAMKAAPWAAEPYAIRAIVRLRAGDAEGARADALEAIEREPSEPRFRALLERVDATS
jgi:hypothetical protein